MKKELALEHYDRLEQFEFFKDFEEPFFGITATVNCKKAYQYCKARQYSFYAYYLHAANTAANAIPNFRQRLQGDRLIEYACIHASTTMIRPDHTFGFAYVEHASDFSTFLAHYTREKNRIHSTRNLMPDTMTNQVIHYSALPWIATTSVSHARKFSATDSCPKITFGKYVAAGNELKLPVSVHAHHALADGYHVGLFFQKLEELLNEGF